eukprot:scaffold47865_cov66-Phaeocystis_antarctica.AAC.1
MIARRWPPPLRPRCSEVVHPADADAQVLKERGDVGDVGNGVVVDPVDHRPRCFRQRQHRRWLGAVQGALVIFKKAELHCEVAT